MGVPGFNTWFARHHKQAYVAYAGRSWDHVYIDMASVLHAAMKKAYNLPHFQRLLFTRLDAIMALSSPKKSVMFALDGPAPLAKLLTQRSRRAKESVKSVALAAAATDAANATGPAATSYISTVKPLDKQANLLPAGSLPANGSPTDQLLQQPNSQKLMSTSTGAAAKKGSRGRPGLSTMGLTPGTPLMAEIEASLEFYICQRLQRWRHLEFELSGARVQGEGETKIMQRMNNDDSVDGSHVIVGNDSDIILMALMSPVKQLYILSQHFKGRTSVTHCISMDAVNMLGSSSTGNGTGNGAAAAGMSMDLVLLAMMSKGNDYLPAVNGSSATEGSLGFWNCYLRLKRSPRWANQQLVLQDNSSTTVCLNPDFMLELLSQRQQRGGRSNPGAYQLPADATRYAQGLVWVLNMYVTGACPDYRWSHDNQAPTASQLAQAIMQLQSPNQFQQEFREAMLPSVCAMALIPRGGKVYIPSALQHLMEPGSPVADVFDMCDTCDQLAEENAQVSREYLKVHKKLQRLTGRRPRRARDVAASTRSSPGLDIGSNGSESAVLASDSSDQDDDLPDESLDQEVDLLDGSPVLAADPADQNSESSESTSAKPVRQDAPSAQLPTSNQPSSNGLASPADADDSPELTEPSDLDHDSAGSSGADTVSEDESEHMASEDPSIAQMQKQASRLRGQMGSLRSKKESHMNAAHPYSPFPVERLEAAVAAVPEEAFAADEAALNRFAQPYLFKWVSGAQLQQSGQSCHQPKTPTGMTPLGSNTHILRTTPHESVRPAPQSMQKIVASRLQAQLQPSRRRLHKHPKNAPKLLQQSRWSMLAHLSPSQQPEMCSLMCRRSLLRTPMLGQTALGCGAWR